MTTNDSKQVPRKLARRLALCAVAAAVVASIVMPQRQTSDAAPGKKASSAADKDTGAVLPDPIDTIPQPWPADTLLPPTRAEYLPRVRIGEECRRGDTKTQRPAHMRPVMVLPEGVRKSDASQPYPLLMPSSVLVQAVAPDPSQLFVSPILTGPDPGRPVLSSDPTAAQSREAAMAATPRLRQKSVPFVRLDIPDPFAAIEPIALHTTPPDSDPPAPVENFPPSPQLPSRNRSSKR